MLKLEGRSATALKDGGLQWQGTKTYTWSPYGANHRLIWTYDLTGRPAKPPCSVVTPKSQKIGSGKLVSKVKGTSGSCRAKLKSVALKINGRNRFVSKSSQSSNVGKGETWAVSLRYGSKAAVLKAAINQGKKVTAVVTYQFDGETVNQTINLH